MPKILKGEGETTKSLSIIGLPFERAELEIIIYCMNHTKFPITELPDRETAQKLIKARYQLTRFEQALKSLSPSPTS